MEGEGEMEEQLRMGTWTPWGRWEEARGGQGGLLSYVSQQCDLTVCIFRGTWEARSSPGTHSRGEKGAENRRI